MADPTQYYIVPINVQAVRLTGHDTGKFKGPTVNFNEVSKGLGVYMDNELSATNATAAMLPGVHLHWALPDAVAHAHQGPDGELEIPAAPNRWLITRYLVQYDTDIKIDGTAPSVDPGTLAPPIVQQWIVESNYSGEKDDDSWAQTKVFQVKNANESNAPGSTGGLEIPQSTELPQAPSVLPQGFGTRMSYDANWQDAELNNGASNYEPRLTVVNYYGPSFGAYYQNSKSNFGFYDDFSDLKKDLNRANFSVSYQVMGWYSEEATNDILVETLSDAKQAYSELTDEGKKETTKGTFYKQYVEQALKWQLPEMNDDADAWPAAVQSIFNGLALNIQWLTSKTKNPVSPEFLDAPKDIMDADKLELAIGNNSAEAISALICKKQIVTPDGSGQNEPYPEVEKNTELLFNAFQQDLLRKLQGSDLSLQVPQLEEYLHNCRFSSYESGNLWSVRAFDNQESVDASDVSEVGLPLAAAEWLSILNNTQRAYDKEQEALEDRQKQAFLDWTNYILGRNPELESDFHFKDPLLVENYLLSELLKIFTKSAKVGEITETANSKGVKAQLQFKPTWTYLNSGVEQTILSMAIAQGQWWFLYPQTLELIGSIVDEAIATFREGNGKNALAFLQQINKAPIGTVLKSLQDLFSNGAISQLLDSKIQALTAQAKMVANLLNDPDNGLLHVRTSYTKSGFQGMMAGKNFLKAYKDDLFTGTSVVDIQEAYMLIEAFSYNLLNPGVGGAKLNQAIAFLQQAQKDINDNILPAFQKTKTTIQSVFDQEASTLQNILTNIGTASKNIDPTQDQLHSNKQGVVIIAHQILNALKEVKTLINQVLDGEKDRIQAGLTLQNNWQSLLTYLPTGHQVVILVKALQSVVSQIDINNQLVRNPAKSYYGPNNPVLLITEPKGAKNILLRVNRNGKSVDLPCRSSDDLLSAIKINNGASISLGDIANKTSVGKVFSNLGDRQALMQNLLAEGYLLTPQGAYDILKNVAGLSESLTTTMVQAQRKIVAQLSEAQENQRTPPIQKEESIKAGDLTMSLSGYLPYYIGLTDLWQGDISYTPFLPLFMAWSANFSPVQLKDGTGSRQLKSVIPSDYLTSNFELNDDHTELTCSKPLNLQQESSLSLKGQITLSNQASIALQQQISIYFKNKGIDITTGKVDIGTWSDFDKELYQAFTYFDKKVILSQGLNGFNSALLEQLLQLQLPINHTAYQKDDQPTNLFDFLIPYFNRSNFDKATVKNLQNINYFLPARAGMLEMKEIFIVDAFGRFFQIGDANANQQIQKQLVVSSSMVPPAACGQTGNNIYLPPRVVQPMQLSFEWLSSASLEGDETTFIERTEQPAFSPVCGWIFPNHLDDSLVIFDGDGSPLGALGLEGHARTMTWRSVPTSTSSYDPTDNGRPQMLTDLKDANPFLQDFMQQYAFPSDGASYFQQFLNVLEQSQVYIHSSNLQQEQSLAVLIGRPLVLVRAALRLDLKGLPEVGLKGAFLEQAALNFGQSDKVDDQSFNPTDPSTWEDYDISKRFNAGFTEMVCPVQLGDLNQFDDGLVGFFLNDDWSTFFSPIAQPTSGPIQKPTFQTIELLPNYESQETAVFGKGSGKADAGKEQKQVIVTMLIDPRTSVHATTGILPVASLEIPADQYASILNKLEVYFGTHPVLMGHQNIQLPIPKERGYDWYWPKPDLTNGKPLPTDFISDKAQFNYTPQTIMDGWLKLKKKDQSTDSLKD